MKRWISQRPKMVFSGFSLLLLITISLLVQGALNAQGVKTTNVTVATLLPGQQIWKGGTSSLLFGSNDPTFNTATSQTLRMTIRQAGITLIRTPLTHNGGSEVEQRLSQIQDIGAQCLGILSTRDIALDEQIVKTDGTRCQMYELGNEPDNPGTTDTMSAQTYANAWNTIVPALRQVSPSAKFFGPVVASPNLGYISSFLQATKANTPDGVTYHMYPCTDVDAQTCLSQSVNSYASEAQKVRATVIQVLGRALPLGVTEWNDNWKNQATPQESDPTFMTQFTRLSLQSLAQGQVAFANQYNLGTGTGDGHLFLTVNGQPKPQLQAMAAIITQTKGSSGNPVATSTQAVDSTIVPPTSSPSTLPPTLVPTQGTGTQQSFGPDGPTWGSAWGADASNGQVFSVHGSVGIITNGQGIYTALSGSSMTNTVVQATLTVNHFTHGTVNAGIVAHATDRENLYKLYIDGSELVLQKRVHGLSITLAHTAFAAQDNVGYMLQLQIVGPLLTGLVEQANISNAERVEVTAQDTSLSSGQCGIRVMVQPETKVTLSSFSQSLLTTI